MIGVQDEQHVERTRQHRIGLVLQLGHLEQHVQEVAGEAQIVVGIDVGPADAVAERPRGNARHLRDRAVHLLQPRLLVEDILGVRIEPGHRADDAEEDGHRVRVVLEPLHQLLDVLVKHGVERDLAGPGLLLLRGRQLAEEDQIRRLEEVALLRELFNRVAAIEQDSLVAVDVGDGAAAVRGVHERRVIRHQAEVVGFLFDLAEVHRPDGAVLDRQLVLLPRAVISDRERVGHRIRKNAEG